MTDKITQFLNQWICEHVVDEPFSIGHGDPVDELRSELITAARDASLSEADLVATVGDLYTYLDRIYRTAQR